MTLDECIARRRSVRQYAPTPVRDEELNAVLEAGRLAPSAKNEQNWHFTAVRDEQTRLRLMEACGGQKMVGEAPVTLVVWSCDERIMACGQAAASVDCSIALSFMMLKAVDLGLGTCWLGHFFAEPVKEILQLPPRAQVIAVTPLGHPEVNPAPRPRKALLEIIDIRE